MRVAAVQMIVSPGMVEDNTTKMLGFVADAARKAVDVVVFPEMSDVGYDMPIIVKTAQAWANGTVSKLQKAAKKNSISIVAGVSERTDEGVYNATAVINSHGEIVGSYRKTHLITAEPMLEHKFLLAGEKLGKAELLGKHVGLMTCYDIRFPEIARSLSIDGAEVLFIPSAFPLVRLPHWTTLLAARAIENQVFVVACNRVGTDAGVTFCGSTTVIDPYGTILASGSDIHECLVIADLDFNMLMTVRSQIKVHQDRRPKLYGLSL